MQNAFDLLAPGRTIYVPGASGESKILVDALTSDPDRMAGVHVITCPFPGINEIDYTGFAPDSSATVFLPPAAVRASAAAGRTRILPLCYSQIASWLASDAEVDVAFAHVSPPNANGLCSLGIAADFSTIAWRAAKKRVLLINRVMPKMQRGPWLPVAEADIVVDADGPILTVEASGEDATTSEIGKRVAMLVPDGATIQIGLGKAPAAVWPCLCHHRDLILASGMVADGFLDLFERGALCTNSHYAGVVLGSKTLVDFVATHDVLTMASVNYTHNADQMARRHAFTAINGALEVDLFGEVNLEWQAGRMISGVGGAPDFVRGAQASKNGRSVIMLPATAKAGTISRIVPRLEMPASLGRRDADTIVTEYGVAELRGRSIDARAEALIEIAAPQHHAILTSAWQNIRRQIWK